MQLYLVRHTTPQVEIGTCYGQTDLALAESFEQELAMVKNKLSHLEGAKLYSSPLQRCAQLAQHFSHMGEINYDARIMELNFGDWEMQKWNDIPKGAIDVWAEEHVMKAPPNGESFNALHLRAKALLSEIAANKSDIVVMFTHAGVIRALLAEALSLPLIHAFKFQLEYASVTKIIVEETVTHVAYVNH